MSGYVEAGYGIAFVTLTGYAASVLLRERSARRRLVARKAETAGRRAVERPGEEQPA